MASYAGLLLAPPEGFGLRPRLFPPLLSCFGLFCNVWCSVVILVTFSSNLGKFERNPKNPNKSKKKSKNFKKDQSQKGKINIVYIILEDMASYSGLLLATPEGFGL